MVTDVGSTKGELVAASSRPADERFIGGHPLAGAETAGVENARADLFEGARWYLTPTERSSGLLYDRLQRAIADLGARPQAIDAETHDRLMATVSHLPHVIANVLVQQAAAAAAEESERLPGGRARASATRPGSRGPTRRSGATSSPPTARRWRARSRRSPSGSREAAELIRSGDARRGRRLARRRPRGPPPPARGRARPAASCASCGSGWRTGRAPSPRSPWRSGRAGVNIEDMALYPAPDMRTGAVSLWVAGGEEAERAAEVVRGPGPPRLRRSRRDALRPLGAAARRRCAPRRTSRSATARR